MNQQQRAVVQLPADEHGWVWVSENECIHVDIVRKVESALRQLLEAEPVQEPVACAVCNEIHAILDADESKIIRDAKDGYPDGRRPRTLTLQERITALCVYASDWKRWCLEKENTTPPAQPAVPLADGVLKITMQLDGLEVSRLLSLDVIRRSNAPEVERHSRQAWLDLQKAAHGITAAPTQGETK